MGRLKRQSKRLLIGIVGGVILLAGMVMIPYPGPGWVVTFAGLAILSQEFDWAQRLLNMAKSKYDVWQAWLSRQSFWVRAVFWIATCLVVIVTIWLLNGYGLMNKWLNLDRDWLISPFF